MKKYTTLFAVIFLYGILAIHSEENDISSPLNPLAASDLDLTNPLKAEFTLERAKILDVLFNGLWFAEKDDSECSGGSAPNGDTQRILFLHKFEIENGTYINSVVVHDEDGNIVRLREMTGTFELQADESEDPQIGFSFKARMTHYRDSRKDPYTEFENPITLIFFIDPIRSDENTLVLGYPQKKGNQNCPSGEIPILRFHRPK